MIILLLVAAIALTTTVETQVCRTSGGNIPNEPCQFPFTLFNETYTTCTWKVSHLVKNKPWCSTKTDARGNHVRGNNGFCDPGSCPIPPRFCGETVFRSLSDREDIVDIRQLPWMTSLGFQKRDNWTHICGGSLITNYFVLTAAHCLALSERLLDARPEERLKVRFGNVHLNLSSDEQLLHEVTEIFQHPKYLVGQAYFDIGLAKTSRRIEYNDYIRPICLPFKPIDDEDAWANDLVTLAGWGRDSNEVVSNTLEIDNLRLNLPEHCEQIFSNDNLKAKGVPFIRRLQQLPRGLQSDHIACAGFEISNFGACEGDSGSPLIRLVTGHDRKPYYEIGFLVTSGLSKTCNLEATLYVRISYRPILNWIQKITDQTPLVMVVGGYNEKVPNGLLRDVEIISLSKGSHCTKQVPPLPGRLLNVGTHAEYESAALGMVGQTTKDAVIVCGGKNGDNNQRKCYKYLPETNKWDDKFPEMKYPRYLASSTLDENGNLWVIGGVNGSSAPDTTEIFDFRRSRWVTGRPLPGDLRQSGINSHCTVSLNKTHVLMAGGFKSAYSFIHPDSGREIEIGGRSLSKAWLFNGLDWEDVPDMSTVRDRPACSLVQLEDGSLRILVAGGCNGWCVDEPAIKSAEMYDPEKQVWTRVADLPEPLSSAKMEILGGVPTIFGGYNNKGVSDKLYQYSVSENRWRAHPTSLRIARSSPAVFQVPRSMFPHC